MNLDEKICKYATLREAIRPDLALQYGTDNMPTPEHLENLKYIGVNIFDPVREFVGGALHGFWYRNKVVNDNTPGASKTSQHMIGQAIDIDCDVYRHGTNADVFYFIKNNLKFDQLIWEGGNKKQPDWVHVSLTRGLNRGLLTRMKKINGKPIYGNFE